MTEEDLEMLRGLGVMEVSPEQGLYRGTRAEGGNPAGQTLKGRPWLYSQPRVAASYAYLYPGGCPVLMELHSRRPLRVLSFSKHSRGDGAPQNDRLLGALLSPEQRAGILDGLSRDGGEPAVEGLYVCFEQGGGRLYLWEPQDSVEVTGCWELPESWDLASASLDRLFGAAVAPVTFSLHPARASG